MHFRPEYSTSFLAATFELVDYNGFIIDSFRK